MLVKLTAAILCCLTANLMATTFYVDQNHPQATDRGPGSVDQPFATISRSTLSAEAADTVIIRPGTYRETSIVMRRSGRPDAPITFMAEVPGTVVISAGQRQDRYHHREYPMQIGPPRRDPQNNERWQGAEWITLKGLTFENSRGSGIGANTGWRIEDCVVRHADFDGIVARGDNITILRTIIEDCGNYGMTGGFGENIVIADSIIRRCNQLPNSPGGYGSASKFLNTRGMRVEGLISYDNFGSGWWMDWDNRDFVITRSTVFGNHAGMGIEQNREKLNQPWAGVGIWTEANDTGRITDNVIFSNTAAGIGILESRNIVIEGNTIVDCGSGIEFRDLNRDGVDDDSARKRNIWNITVRNNRIKDWRGRYAIETSIGEFKRGNRPADYQVTIDGNVYDPPDRSAGFIKWINAGVDTLEAARVPLGIAGNGRIESFDFAPPLIRTYSTGEKELSSTDPDRFRQVDSRQAEAVGFDDALAGAVEGDVVHLRVHGRTPTVQSNGSLSAEVYDLKHKRHLTLMLTPESRRALEARVQAFAALEPVELKVRITSLKPYALTGELVE